MYFLPLQKSFDIRFLIVKKKFWTFHLYKKEFDIIIWKFPFYKESFGKLTFFLYKKSLTYALFIVTQKICFSSLQKRIWHKLSFTSFFFIKKVLTNALVTFTKKFWHTRFWSLQTNFGQTLLIFTKKNLAYVRICKFPFYKELFGKCTFYLNKKSFDIRALDRYIQI